MPSQLFVSPFQWKLFSLSLFATFLPCSAAAAYVCCSQEADLDWTASLAAKQTAVAITAGSETENAQVLISRRKETTVVITGFRAKVLTCD